MECTHISCGVWVCVWAVGLRCGRAPPPASAPGTVARDARGGGGRGGQAECKAVTLSQTSDSQSHKTQTRHRDETHIYKNNYRTYGRKASRLERSRDIDTMHIEFTT